MHQTLVHAVGFLLLHSLTLNLPNSFGKGFAWKEKRKIENPRSLMPSKLNILLVVEQCDPKGMSVPLVGYQFFEHIRPLANVTLVTKEKYRDNLSEILPPDQEVHYIEDGPWIQCYARWIPSDTLSSQFNWHLWHMMRYPLYAAFNRQVYKRYAPLIKAGKFDLVHAVTPMIPRYPFKISQACTQVPFILGPVNGGFVFPQGFEEVAKKEFSGFRALRFFTHFLPGYRKTYRNATTVLAGSTHTKNLLSDMFQLTPPRVQLFFENGVHSSFFSPPSPQNSDLTQLLFVGRLVPCKGIDLIIRGMHQLPQKTRNKVQLTLVGEGPERPYIESLVKKYQLQEQVHFAGWIPQASTREFYQKSHVFCFPSVREFGGAVVLEAMAAGLPCVIANQGGMAEYVIPETGFKIDLQSKEHVIRKLSEHIQFLVENPSIRETMGQKAQQRARDFEWPSKGEQLIEIYEEAIHRKEKETS